MYRINLFLWICILLNISVIKIHAAKQHLVVTLERDNVKFSDPRYIILHEHLMSRANRTASYTYKINFTAVVPWYNNVTVEMKGYEGHNNEYRESLISFKYQICDLYSRENFVLKMFQKQGNFPKKCPMEKNLYIKDFSVKDDDIPAFFPQSKWMVEWKIYTTKQKIPIFQMEVYFDISAKTVSKKKSKKH